MSDLPTEKDTQYWMGRMCGSIEAIQSDIEEIKDVMIPDGKSRLEKVEDKVQTLTVWKKATTAISVLLIASASWIEAKLNIIGGIFNG